MTIPAAREDRPRREFGFVHFKERSSAVSVVESGETFTLDGNELNVRDEPFRAALRAKTCCRMDACGAAQCSHHRLSIRAPVKLAACKLTDAASFCRALIVTRV